MFANNVMSMESSNLTNSVQDEQFSKSSGLTETTKEPSSTLNEDQTVIKPEPENQTGLNKGVDNDEFEINDDHVILPEDLSVPEELLDEEDELSDEAHIHDSSADYASLSKEELIKTAEKLLKENIYNVAIVDLRLTGVNGEEGLKIIKYVKEFYSQTEVILVTGYGSPAVMEKAQAKGAAFYFEKPVSSEVLKKAMRSLNIG